MKLIIERYGNFGGDNPNDTYRGSGEINAVAGSYSLSDIDCGGFYASDVTLEIVSVSYKQTELKLFGKNYVVTPDEPLVVERTSNEQGYGGEHFTASDEITVWYKGE